MTTHNSINLQIPSSSTNRGVVTWSGTVADQILANATPLIDSSGRMTNTNQPAFSVYNGTNIVNTTGDGTNYTILFDTSSLNVGTGYATGTGLFTAPVAGNYLFTYSFFVTTTSVYTAISSFLIINGTNRYKAIPALQNATSNSTYQSFSIFIPLSASDTVGVVFAADTVAGTKNTTISGDSTLRSTTFTGFLLS